MRFTVAAIALSLIALLFVRACLGLDFTPIPDAAGAIRADLKSMGYDLRGYICDYVQESDDWGGLEVRLQFQDVQSHQQKRNVTVQARRSWILASWHITKLSVDE
jgi:hypothetical protein